MADLSNIKLLLTHPHSCSYLEDKEATTVFVSPETDIDQSLYTVLSEIGFRRSGIHIYRPHCHNCQACISTRIPVNKFSLSRSQSRITKKNQRFTFQIETCIADDKYYELYANYINQRHAEGDMYPRF